MAILAEKWSKANILLTYLTKIKTKINVRPSWIFNFWHNRSRIKLNTSFVTNLSAPIKLGWLFFYVSMWSREQSVSVYYVAVRTIVLSCHGSNLAWSVIIHDIIHSLMCLMCMPSTSHCGFSGVSPDGNGAYVYWGSFTSNSKSVRRAIWFTWFSEPHDTTSLHAVLVYTAPDSPRRSPSNYEPGARLLNFSDRADTDETTPYSKRGLVS